MRCKECGAGGDIDETSFTKSVDVISPQNTIGLLLFVPDRCARCNNIRAVPPSKEPG
jgi:hypothetical protein